MLVNTWVACLWPVVETTPWKLVIFQIPSSKVELYLAEE